MDLRGDEASTATTETEEKLKQEVSRSPQSFEANEHLGEFYCHAGRYSEAIARLRIASEMRPDSVANTDALALSYAGGGDLSHAREQRDKLTTAANSAQVHRFLGDIDEQLREPLAAVREYEQAARLEASEENYFAWGAELLVHRAAQPAEEVFVRGLKAYPLSARMLTGLGAASFAEGNYEAAAQRLCAAADLRPADSMAYIFLGKMEKATARVAPCSQEKLAGFASQQPGNAAANYYYGLVLWKEAKGIGDLKELRRAETLLQKATELDPKMGDAFLQLGIVRADQGDLTGAIAAYQKAVGMAPRLGEAHYRLSLACRRTGDEAGAQREMDRYRKISKADEAEFARQQKELQQFLVVLKKPAAGTSPQ
jgi:tetratricopeptide (TPR) repeat protein